MSANLPNELANFHQFIGEQLDAAEAKLSPEEALDLWRAQHPPTEGFGETVAALREAISDMAAGDTGLPLAEFDREFRQRRLSRTTCKFCECAAQFSL